MDKAFADKWVAALRSGEYEQIKGCLHDGWGYCCLGVLEIVVGSSFVERGSYFVTDHSGDEVDLSRETRTLVGIKFGDAKPQDEDRLVVGGISADSLADANDDGRTFCEIADAIEQNWERL